MKIDVPKSGYLRVKVIPKSSKNELTEIMKDSDADLTYKIRIKAAPEKGKANKELIKFLSKSLELPKENFKIISGKTDQLKLIKVS